MSYKRSRAAFEADVQKQESPYVYYGTPLPPLGPGIRDDGSFVPLWEQEVRDERGRKRLHGAFTGGFSAGYFNTVGSKEGWTPSTFVSSRSTRDSAQVSAQRPEDFMDDEDLAEAENSRHIQTANDFSGLGGTAEDQKRQGGLTDLFRPPGDTIGVKLLQKMGWREGQGIGPKIRRAAHHDIERNRSSSELHFFAPSNVKIISFARKDDSKGLGYAEAHKASSSQRDDGVLDRQADSDDEMFSSRSKPQPSKPARKRGGFGTGILNGGGSDEEDPYEVGPRVSYNRILGGEPKLRPYGSNVQSRENTANPLLSNRPVFVKSTGQHSKSSKNSSRRCHDGRPSLAGFVLAVKPVSPQRIYPAPKIPEGWTSRFSSILTQEGHGYKSTTDVARGSNLKPGDRANMLGEYELPGKSVFDFLSPAARDRLANASGRGDLPAAGNEALPMENSNSDTDAATLCSRMPHLDPDVASAALGRIRNISSNGWTPYSDDASKQKRYIVFLELKAGSSAIVPERGKGIGVDDFLQEMAEFAQAARVFRPIGGTMASRFAPSSSSDAQNDVEGTNATVLPGPAKKSDPAVEAARLGMYGPLTRQVSSFYPTRLICKRFNVPPPTNVHSAQYDSNDPQQDTKARMRRTDGPLGSLHHTSLSPLSSLGGGFVSTGTEGGSPQPAEMARKNSGGHEKAQEAVGPAAVDVETNNALEQPRPGQDIFKAIFGSDDDDDDDDDY